LNAKINIRSIAQNGMNNAKATTKKRGKLFF